MVHAPALSAAEIEELIKRLETIARVEHLHSIYAEHLSHEDRIEWTAATALRFLLKEREWKPADTAPKDEEILGLTLEWNDCKRPILLRWFNYNGLEAWRDFEAESNTLIWWRPLPSPPQSQGDRPVVPNDEVNA